VNEASLRFRCFGSEAAVHVGGPSDSQSAVRAAAQGRRRLLEAHRRLSRFDPDSELCELNHSPSQEVPCSPLMRRFVAAVVAAGRRSGGLVDATQLDQIELAGYRHSREKAPSLPLSEALVGAAARRPALPDPDARWQEIVVDELAGTVARPPGLHLDSGGIAKGLAADLVAAGLRGHPTYAVNCAGDIRIGGSARLRRTVLVDDPFGGEPLQELQVTDGAVATSGIGKRAWLRDDGPPAHHLLDPQTGTPAFTGIVQVTALAPTAQLCEVLAKTALLRGPAHVADSLPHGGVVVYEDRSFDVVPATGAAAAIAAPALSGVPG
jgi:FAD:protein FMN transferase